MRAPTRTLPLVLAALFAAGCGGPAAVRERTGTFTVTLDDYLIRPQAIRVPKDRPLQITVVNHGRLGHTFRIRSVSRNVLKITTIPPGGRTTSKTFRLAAGKYTMYCAIANHEELGMSGTLTVG